jgi:hypothetical protein
MDFSETIRGHTLEYFDDTHTYLVDGVIVPSITQILKLKFGGKYKNVRSEVLNRASEKGTEVHEAIQNYCERGEESDIVELRNFKFLQRAYHFRVVGNEIPVILSMDDKPVSAGRLDLVLEIDGKIGLADIKRTSVLDKEYLAYQLNLYRIAYQQCYETPIDFLKGVHLREDTRKFVDIPINEERAIELVKEYEELNNE